MTKYIIYKGKMPLATCNTRADAEEMTYAYIEDRAYNTYLEWIDENKCGSIEDYLNDWRCYYNKESRNYSFNCFLLAVEDTFEIVETRVV